MRLRPLGDRLVIERKQTQERTPGGIYLPESVQAQEKPLVGVVRYAGPGRKREDGWRDDMEVKIGDIVLFGKYAGVEQELDDGFKVLIMSESDVIAVVEMDGDAGQGLKVAV